MEEAGLVLFNNKHAHREIKETNNLLSLLSLLLFPFVAKPQSEFRLIHDVLFLGITSAQDQIVFGVHLYATIFHCVSDELANVTSLMRQNLGFFTGVSPEGICLEKAICVPPQAAHQSELQKEYDVPSFLLKPTWTYVPCDIQDVTEDEMWIVNNYAVPIQPIQVGKPMLELKPLRVIQPLLFQIDPVTNWKEDLDIWKREMRREHNVYMDVLPLHKILIARLGRQSAFF